jgi:hypothetical protein
MSEKVIDKIVLCCLLVLVLWLKVLADLHYI